MPPKIGVWASSMHKIEPAVDEFFITWLVSLKCNYDCSYCGPDSHDVNGVVHSSDHYIKEFNALYEIIKDRSNIHINITGGEPTQISNLVDLCKHIKTVDPSIVINVNTNGSKGVDYFFELIRWIDALDVSLHFEYVKLQAFLKKMGKLHQKIKSRLTIYVMAEENYYEQCKRTLEILDKFNFNFILSSIIPRKYSIDYSEEYLDLFKKYPSESALDVIVDGKVTSSLEVKNSLITNWYKHDPWKKNYFTDWRCWVTSQNLSLSNGTLLGGMCAIKNYGSVFDKPTLIESVTCRNGLLDTPSTYTFRGRCMCNADLRARKERL